MKYLLWSYMLFLFVGVSSGAEKDIPDVFFRWNGDVVVTISDIEHEFEREAPLSDVEKFLIENGIGNVTITCDKGWETAAPSRSDILKLARFRQVIERSKITIREEKVASSTVKQAQWGGLTSVAHLADPVGTKVYHSPGLKETDMKGWVNLYDATQIGWLVLAPDSRRNLATYKKMFDAKNNHLSPKVIDKDKHPAPPLP